MTVIQDDNKNIQRIVDVIKADPLLFDNGKTVGKLREVNFGDPENNKKLAIKQKPAVYVTTKNSIQQTSYPFGISQSNNVNAITVQYDIVLIATSKIKTVESQKQLYSLLTNLRNRLNANPRFTDPTSGLDPIFSRSITNEIPWDPKTRGQLNTSITFTISATIGDGLTITIPGFGDLDIISDSGDDGRNNTTIPNDEGNTKRSKGAFVGVRFFEYEYATTTFDSLEAIIIADNPLTLTLKYPSGNKSYPCKLEYQRQTERFTGIRTVFLQVNRETA